MPGDRSGQHGLSLQSPRARMTSHRSAKRLRVAAVNAPGWNRTSGLSLRRRTLYPLSYGRRGFRSVALVELTAQRATLRLAETFTISRGSEDEAEVVQVAITHDGATGYGEAAPIERYAESAETALEWLEDVELGDDPFALDELDEQLPQGDRAARAAVDAALHDLQGKLTGLPVYRLLGVRPAGPPTSWTIWLGDPDDMARRTEKIANRGFKRLKLKLGGFDGLDVERVNAVRGVTDLPLMCDANEAWTLDEALEIIPQLDVEYVEQPLKAGDEDGRR